MVGPQAPLSLEKIPEKHMKHINPNVINFLDKLFKASALLLTEGHTEGEKCSILF